MTGRPESEFPPSGCRWCGVAQDSHFQRWSDARADAVGKGWHVHEPPTTEQIKERMLGRRALRDVPRIPAPDRAYYTRRARFRVPMDSALADLAYDAITNGEG